MSGQLRVLVNPYAKKPSMNPHNGAMGRQSQQRISNNKRAFAFAANNPYPKRGKKGQQLTLTGILAFEAEKDCIICNAHLRALRDPDTVRIPKRAHHILCIKNTKTKGRGLLSQQHVAAVAEEKRLSALFTTPLAPEERGSWKHSTKEAGEAFFAPRQKKQVSLNETTMTKEKLTAKSLYDGVTKLVSDISFCEKHKSKSAPLAMIAFANEVTKKIISNKEQTLDDYFDGITMTVPDCDNSEDCPYYHSIVGQKLILVDWK